MTLTRVQKEAKLRKAADELVEAMLTWDEQNGAPTLTEIEEEILALRQRVGQEMLAIVLAGQAEQQPVAEQQCPTCGAAVRPKGAKGRLVESRVGGLKLERGYYYCARCQSGFFPPGPPT